MSDIEFNNGYASGFAAQNSLLFQLATAIQQANISDAIQNEVLVSDTSQLLNCWSRYSLIEYVETNFEALDLNLPALANNTRNFVRIHKQNLSFLTSELSETETETYKTFLGDTIYYTAIGDHPNAYKYFTLTDPVRLAQNSNELTEEEKEAIREPYIVKVRKALNTISKLEIGFDETEPMAVPKITLGSGNEANNGKGFIYKNVDGLYLTYTTQTDNENVAAGTEVGLRISDGGIEVTDDKTGEWRKVGDNGAIDIGKANLVFLDHTPTPQETAGDDGSALYVVYDLYDTTARWGTDAFDVASDMGYAGTREQYNNALSQVGNMEMVLDMLLAEEG